MRVSANFILPASIALGIAIAFCPAARAEDATGPGGKALPAPSPDPRDLNGVWFREATIDDPVARNKYGDNVAPPPLPPMSPEALAIHNKIIEGRISGHPFDPEHPDPEVRCAPPGIEVLMFMPYPFQIVQTPGQITFVHEDARSNRFIHMDEKQPDKPPPLTWLGHSVGHWEGDTLVVDTIAERPENEIYPHLRATPKTHFVERIRKIDGGKKLEDVFTVDDPDYYPTPFHLRLEYLWWPQTRVREYVCEEADHPEDEAAAAYH
jgi:hypothetical protein